MKVCVLQTDTTNDKARNLRQAEALMRKAMAEEDPDLLVLPEHFDYAGGTVEEKVAAGESATGGPAWTLCRDIAREYKVNVVSGSFFERTEGESRVLNTSVLFDRNGQEKARYSKIHLFDIVTPDGMEYRESASVKPGRLPVVGEVDGWKIGLTICYDVRFPELYQALMKAGADIITVPAAFTLQTGKDHWDVLLRARAIETECYIVAPGQVGAFLQDGQKRFCYGNSLVADPWGHIITKVSDNVGYGCARLEKAKLAEVRAQIPLLQHKVL